MRKLAPALIVCLGLSACGTQPPATPDLSKPVTPEGVMTFTEEGNDVTFIHPGNWVLSRRTPPGIATVASADASVTVWAYTATSPVLDGRSASTAMQRLLASLKKRDPHFVVTKAAVVPGYGVPAVQIEGRTKIAGHPVRVRSVHIWKGVGEYVVDALADPRAFEQTNSVVFSPLLKSVQLGGRPTPSGGQTPTQTPPGATPPPKTDTNPAPG